MQYATYYNDFASTIKKSLFPQINYYHMQSRNPFQHAKFDSQWTLLGEGVIFQSKGPQASSPLSLPALLSPVLL